MSHSRTRVILVLMLSAIGGCQSSAPQPASIEVGSLTARQIRIVDASGACVLELAAPDQGDAVVVAEVTHPSRLAPRARITINRDGTMLAVLNSRGQDSINGASNTACVTFGPNGALTAFIGDLDGNAVMLQRDSWGVPLFLYDPTTPSGRVLMPPSVESDGASLPSGADAEDVDDD